MKRRRSLLVVAVTTLALLGAACGDDDADDGATATTQPPGGATTAPSGDAGGGGDDADIDPNGVLRITYDLATTGGFHLDPILSTSPNDFNLQRLIYGNLLHKTIEGDYEPDLAESATVVDPQTITVTLREGLQFSDGTPLDAEAVKASIERIKASNNVRTFRVEIAQVEEVEVTSPTDLTIHLATPIAGVFYDLLAYGETFVFPPQPAANFDAAPIGAGPFMLESYTPEQSLRLVKNPNYWNADAIRLAGVEWVQASAGPPQVNALRSGAADAAALDATLLDSLQGTDVEVVNEPSDSSFIWFPTCKSTPPFDDVRVRQALIYALDRDAMTESLTGGAGEPMRGFWTSKSRFFNPELADSYPHDPERARQLLAEAGQENLRFDVMVVPQPLLVRFAEIAQQQWAEVGVTANLIQTPNIVQDFYTDRKAPLAASPLNRFGLDKVTRNLTPGSIGNTCDYNNPELNELVAQLRGVDQTSDEAVELWHQIDKLTFDEALAIYGIFVTQPYAWSPDVGGVVFVPDVFGRIQLDPRQAYIKA